MGYFPLIIPLASLVVLANSRYWKMKAAKIETKISATRNSDGIAFKKLRNEKRA
jgi:hypothetical protein